MYILIHFVSRPPFPTTHLRAHCSVLQACDVETPMPGLRGNIWKVRAKINKTNKRGAGSIAISSINAPYDLICFLTWHHLPSIPSGDGDSWIWMGRARVTKFWSQLFRDQIRFTGSPWAHAMDVPNESQRLDELFWQLKTLRCPKVRFSKLQTALQVYTNQIWTCRHLASNFLNPTFK